MNKTLRRTPLEKAKVKIRQDGDDGPEFITGYAAVFYRKDDPGSEYWLWDDYVERIMPGAFDRALDEDHDARGLFDHDSQSLLGRVSSGTCMLSVDDVGLRFEIPVDKDDPDHSRVVPKIRRGDLSGCSFAFSNASATWEEIATDKDPIFVRNITDLDLWDVGPVTWPAYSSTETGLRGKAPFGLAIREKSQLVEARSILTKQCQINRRSIADQVDMDWRWANVQN